MSRLRPPARRPCATCPYAKSTPSGVWAAEEYAKLPDYDNETGYQPVGVFQCHQQDVDSSRARVCAGWAGCHNGNPRGHELLAYRVAVPYGVLSMADLEATMDYRSPVPLFASGEEAARHGVAEIDAPSADAQAAIEKIRRARPSVSGSAADVNRRGGPLLSREAAQLLLAENERRMGSDDLDGDQPVEIDVEDE